MQLYMAGLIIFKKKASRPFQFLTGIYDPRYKEDLYPLFYAGSINASGFLLEHPATFLGAKMLAGISERQ